MQLKPPFDNELKRLEILRRLNKIPGSKISDKDITKYPSIPLYAFNDEAALN
jgi:hypothetical protein